MNHRDRERDEEERQRDERSNFRKGGGENKLNPSTSPNYFVLIPLVCRAAHLGISTQKVATHRLFVK